MRKIFIISSIAISALVLVWAYFWKEALFAFLLNIPLIYMGVVDMMQNRQAIRKNFPLLGRLRYVFEDMRPKIQQYFVESDTDGTPLNRNERSFEKAILPFPERSEQRINNKVNYLAATFLFYAKYK